MIKYILAIISLFTLSSFLHAQEIDEDGKELLVKCHTYEMMDKLLEQHPELKQTIEASEARQQVFREAFLKTYEKKDMDIYTIPVVFHVIHNNGEENISPEQIESAIDIMNKDFAAQTPGIATVVSSFTNLISNTGIRFALARRDPDGNCTNGIVRAQSEITYTGGENLKMLSPIWDRSKYLNIWVCNSIESGAAGYSRYPSSVDNSYGDIVDGIVIKHDYVGTMGTSTAFRSHSLTHEAGHYLDLPHLWGSTNDPELEENCYTDDGIEDTPNTIGWTTCNISGESCGSLDNVQNFMEYSYCSKMYTHGQAARMVAALNSPVAQRSNLWQESNLIETGVYEENVLCTADFISTKRTICVGDSIQFEDYSYSGVNTRTWIFEGGSPAVSNAEKPYITFNNPGLFSVSLAAGDGTNYVSTSKNQYIRVLDTANVVLPYFEGFENLNTFQNNQSPVWYAENSNGNNSWEITTDASFSGSKSAMINGLESAIGDKSALLSQTFDMSYFDSTNAALTFKYACKRKNSQSADKLIVYVSRNCGDDWIARKTITGDALYTAAGTQQEAFFPNYQEEWNEAVISNLVPVFFTPEFRIKFEFISNDGNNVFIDDINLIKAYAVSVNDIEALQNGVNIYPNPASSVVNIEIENTAATSDLSIDLYDISGRLLRSVYSGRLSEKTRFEVDVNPLPSGLYFLHFTTSGGRFAQKFVINK